MPLLDATDWNNIQISDATNDKRFSELGIVDAVKESTRGVDYIPPSAVEQLRKSSSLRQLEIPVLKDQQVTVVTTPGFANIPSNLPESDKYSFTAVDLFSGFRHYDAQYDNNMVDGEWAKTEVMKNVAYALGNSVESLLSTTLETRKTQVLANTTQVSQGDGTFTFNASTDTLSVSKAAQKETMFYNLEQLMAANELPGNYRIATNRAGLSVQKSEAAKYGASNDKNLQALGMLDASRMHESGNIAAGSDVFNGWFLRDGSIGVYENFPYDFRNGTKFAGKEWSITDVELPFSRMRANVYVNNEATDATALVGAGTDSNLIMTHFKEMAIWLRFYIVHPYNSDLATRSNDIVKIKGLTS
ncbi:hypothetical protein [uncultured Winogradskyella sp.]|uniref:hypothetical protein n=1 Tax=uncultured Winogradskyella sp. TaxID=395353 RepID=UPI00262EB667|nr:hypothetical protein [uncultured Winogradskyella sp.]